jgi:hypothetical protein
MGGLIMYYIFDHHENEQIEIKTIEDFIEWINYLDDGFSFALEPFTFEKRSA